MLRTWLHASYGRRVQVLAHTLNKCTLDITYRVHAYFVYCRKRNPLSYWSLPPSLPPSLPLPSSPSPSQPCCSSACGFQPSTFSCAAATECTQEVFCTYPLRYRIPSTVHVLRLPREQQSSVAESSTSVRCFLASIPSLPPSAYHLQCSGLGTRIGIFSNRNY